MQTGTLHKRPDRPTKYINHDESSEVVGKEQSLTALARKIKRDPSILTNQMEVLIDGIAAQLKTGECEIIPSIILAESATGFIPTSLHTLSSCLRELDILQEQKLALSNRESPIFKLKGLLGEQASLHGLRAQYCEIVKEIQSGKEAPLSGAGIWLSPKEKLDKILPYIGAFEGSGAELLEKLNSFGVKRIESGEGFAFSSLIKKPTSTPAPSSGADGRSPLAGAGAALS